MSSDGPLDSLLKKQQRKWHFTVSVSLPVPCPVNIYIIRINFNNFQPNNVPANLFILFFPSFYYLFITIISFDKVVGRIRFITWETRQIQKREWMDQLKVSSFGTVIY